MFIWRPSSCAFVANSISLYFLVVVFLVHIWRSDFFVNSPPNLPGVILFTEEGGFVVLERAFLGNTVVVRVFTFASAHAGGAYRSVVFAVTPPIRRALPRKRPRNCSPIKQRILEYSSVKLDCNFEGSVPIGFGGALTLSEGRFRGNAPNRARFTEKTTAR